MKIVVWDGCHVVSEQEFPGDGPDLHLDPGNLPEQVSVRRVVDGISRHQVVDISGVAR